MAPPPISKFYRPQVIKKNAPVGIENNSVFDNPMTVGSAAVQHFSNSSSSSSKNIHCHACRPCLDAWAIFFFFYFLFCIRKFLENVGHRIVAISGGHFPKQVSSSKYISMYIVILDRYTLKQTYLSSPGPPFYSYMW